MTISSTTTRVQYSGNGATTSFPVNFVFWDDDDLTVILTDSSGNETTWVKGTQYTITGGAGSTGTLSVVTSPTNYTPASGETLTIISSLAYTQPTAIPVGGALPSASIEQQLDQSVRQIQQLYKFILRCLQQPDSDAVDIGRLPLKASRASMYLGFDANGDPVAVAAAASAALVTSFTQTLLDDASANAFLQTLVAALTAETAPATDDVVTIGDTSASSGRKMTLANLLKVINGLTEDTTPDRVADFVPTYDASGAAAKKVLLRNVGRIAQVVNTQTGASATGTTTIPLDNTIPQNTEGDQYMSLAITPTNASSTLIIDVVAQVGNDVAAAYTIIGALFQDSTADALAAIAQSVVQAGTTHLRFRHKMTAGTTSATTFKFRAGCSAAGTTRFNGSASAAILNGVAASSITITEVLP